MYFSLMFGRVMLTCDSFALVGWTSTPKGGLGELTEMQQTTLLQWASKHLDEFDAAEYAKRGVPPAYKLTFGDYEGFTLRHVIMDGCKHKLNPGAKCPGGQYIWWVCGNCAAASTTPFIWSFPTDLRLYFALLQWEREGIPVVINRQQWCSVRELLTISDEVKSCYEEFCTSVLTPNPGSHNLNFRTHFMHCIMQVNSIHI